MERLGGFPKREKPTAEYPCIDLQNEFISFEELDQKISELKLSLYHPSTKLKKNLPPEVLAKSAASTRSTSRTSIFPSGCPPSARTGHNSRTC
jgi:hypothetical protein